MEAIRHKIKIDGNSTKASPMQTRSIYNACLGGLLGAKGGDVSPEAAAMETAATINTTRVKDIYSYSCLVHICVALVAELDVFLNQPAETPLTVALVS